MSPRCAAVNVDVDSLYLYYGLHDVHGDTASNAVWERGIPRFLDLFDELGIRATFFVVAQDLERWPQARQIAEKMVAAGHEIASHSWSHPYDLTRMDDEEIREEVTRSRDLLSEVRGSPVTGFRAPGYTLSDRLLELLAEAGYAYDSSLFPCPPYYLAKAGVMAWMRMWGKTSQAILDHPRVMWAPRRPHRRSGLLEIPITVLPGIRAPFIGTSLLMMGSAGYRLLRPLLGASRFVNLEFHGIDLCDLEVDHIDPVLAKQPDMRVPLAKKTALFRRVLEDLQSAWGIDTLEALRPRLDNADG